MATKKKSEYESKAVPVSIKFSSRASIKIGDNFYTVEASEERMIPQIEGVNMDKERQLLWDTVNNECDQQVADIVDMYKEKNQKRK